MAGSNLTAIQSNAQPSGGTTATQPVAPNMTPQTISALIEALTPAVAQFRAQSSPLSVALNQATLSGAGASIETRIASVGLGYRMITEHAFTVELDNTSDAAQVVLVSPLFPYNLVGKTSVEINGGATVYNASGIATLGVMLRNRRSTFVFSTQGGFGPALSPALVRVSVSGGTVTNATAPTLSGIESISIAASTTCTITVTFYTREKLAFDSDTLLGALPLQNNSTYATVTRNLIGSVVGSSSEQDTPFAVSADAVPSSLTVPTFQDIVNTTYKFWSVPPNSALYADMVQNSYQVQEQSSLTVSADGTQALTYDIPQNQYLVAAHIWGFDANKVGLTALALPKMQLIYNAGGVVPVNMFQGRERAEQFMDYGDDRQILGFWRFWDGEDTTESINNSDQAGWIDTYAAATPQLVADVASTVAVPIKFSLTRESIVAGSVQVVGG